ncbi:alpha/beta hydrolase [Microlunatus soli]|uniref:Lysophospholipase, alpha-beta hydrolase superfamily n=1 Tax=Microlunatus soli TaxID=630515 RepID=A0A1H1VVX3_9ACTN|nr:alpha/beta hydrolase [Microlunatus soli]SDS89034.1 Lysophospholipase, alpha-beta hydrolase superfamily [Microlunatus soli]
MTTGTETSWHPDILPGYQSRELPLADAELVPGEQQGGVGATLVRRSGRRRAKAVLYLHGWNDYFFQTHLGDFFADLGYDFYAVDLRRYGRSLREGQLQGYITALDHYSQELDAAVKIINDEAPGGGRRQLVISGHSTGGLIAALYAADRPGAVDGVVLNSPWLDLQGSAMVRTIGTPVIDALAKRGLSTTAIPMPGSDLYARSLRSELDGEWDYDPAWKSITGAPILIGWIRAIRQGHARVAAGLGITVPILVMCSARTLFRRRWHRDLTGADTVLDVEQIAHRAPNLGRHVSIVRFDGGLHDLVLSAKPVREAVFAEMEAWLGYLPTIPPGPQAPATEASDGDDPAVAAALDAATSDAETSDASIRGAPAAG